MLINNVKNITSKLTNKCLCESTTNCSALSKHYRVPDNFRFKYSYKLYCLIVIVWTYVIIMPIIWEWTSRDSVVTVLKLKIIGNLLHFRKRWFYSSVIVVPYDQSFVCFVS